jgi:hypothetical protein
MTDTAATQQLSALDREIERVKNSFNANEEGRKAALACGDSWKAGRYAVAAAQDRATLRSLVQQRSSNTPVENGRGSPGQVFFGSHW